jgi:metal-sulfur cluster biosynthetic enzyme/Fe-S cluster assembly iron-binding protein IscA
MTANGRAAKALSDPTLKVAIRPTARSELARALSVRAANSVVRLFIEPGIHPRVAMILDVAHHDDLHLVVDDIPLVVDPPSRRFIADAVVDFVQTAEGAGFRITGPNIPVDGTSTEATAAVSDPRGRSSLGQAGPAARADREGRLMGELRKLYDPEIPMNIVELGLIYGVEWSNDHSVVVRMTMTSPGCPVIEVLCDEVRRAALRTPGIAEAKVDVVWDPPWGPDKMSELARRQLGFA